MNPAGEEPFIPDYDPNDNLLDFLKEAVAENRAPRPARRETEPPGEAAPEQHISARDAVAAPEPPEGDIAELLTQRQRSEAARQPTFPTAIRPIFANFAAELETLPNWVMCRCGPKPGKAKPDKVPFQPNGNFAKTNDDYDLDHIRYMLRRIRSRRVRRHRVRVRRRRR